MTMGRQRILEMLAEKKITVEEAEELLAAIRPRRPVQGWLLRPLERFDTRTALVVSAVTAVLQLLVSRLNVRFDGALDAHLSPVEVSWPTALLDLALAWPLVALVFWAAALLVARQGRFVDFLAGVGVARIPLVATGAIAGALRSALLPVQAGQLNPAIVIFGLVSVVLVVWFVALLVSGLRTASGLGGVKLGLTTFGAIILAEAGTKLLLAIL